MSPIFIAEIKTRSPFGFVSPYSFATLMREAIKHGDWISVHTNALWGGDFDTISYVRQFTDKPILAKGFHGSDEAVQSALYHGATYVLSVNRVPKSEYLASRCIFEFDNLDLPEATRKSYQAFREIGDESNHQFMDMLHQGRWAKFLQGNTVVCNHRNLKDGSPKLDDKFDDYFKRCGKVIQASGIKSVKQVNPNAFGFIVGENLVNFVKDL
jgi:indole-3-glycerol phosphate synthase